jgi:hypothetical protein
VQDHFREGFEETENPVHAWEGWRFYRRSRLPLPEWMLLYLDRCAEVVDRLSGGAVVQSAIGRSYWKKELRWSEAVPEDNIPRAISVGFGFTSDRGRPSAFTAQARELRDSLLAFEAAIRIGTGRKPADAYAEVAGRYQVDERTVERIYKDHELGSYLSDEISGGIEKYGRPVRT